MVEDVLDDAPPKRWLGRHGFHDAGYVIDADFCGVWAWVYRPDRTAWEGGSCGEGCHWDGDHPLPEKLIHDFYVWQNRFECADHDGALSGESIAQRLWWRDFHAEGIRLAKKLKKVLGPEYVVIYSKPFEDLPRVEPRNFLVTEEGRIRPYRHVPQTEVEPAEDSVQ